MIISFTTVPPRFAHLGAVVQAIGAQRLRPDRVELYLPRQYRRFPGERPTLPPLPDWLTVIEVDQDYGPATKILPALTTWRGLGVDILFCDDDKAYDPDWTSRFAAMRRDHPDDALCEYGRELEHVTRTAALRRIDPPGPRAVPVPNGPKRGQPIRLTDGPDGPAHRHFISPGHMDVVFGFGGVMIGSDWLDHRAHDIPEILWTVDDIWLSGMLELHGHKIWVGHQGQFLAGPTPTGTIAALRDFTEQGHDRIAANALCVRYFRDTHGIWL